MKYKLLDNQVKIKQANKTWLLYSLISITFLGYYFFRKAIKFEGNLLEIITTILLFSLIYGGLYFLGFILPGRQFKKNLIGELVILDQNWFTPNNSIIHKNIDSIKIYHEFIKRNNFTYDGNDYSWYVSVKLNELHVAFFVETTPQIEYLRTCIAEYYKRGINIQESFGKDKLSSFVLFVCQNEEEIRKVKEQYF